MIRFVILGLALVTILAAACASSRTGPLRIDGSSAETCAASWNKLEASLNARQQQQLELALVLIGSDQQRQMGTLATSRGVSPETIRQQIDGKDFEQILALAQATGARVTHVEHSASHEVHAPRVN